MAAFQVIEEKGKPKFVVLPFGDQEAIEDYMDELWAEQAFKEYDARKNKRFYKAEDVWKRLGLDKAPKRRNGGK